MFLLSVSVSVPESPTFWYIEHCRVTLPFVSFQSRCLPLYHIASFYLDLLIKPLLVVPSAESLANVEVLVCSYTSVDEKLKSAEGGGESLCSSRNSVSVEILYLVPLLEVYTPLYSASFDVTCNQPSDPFQPTSTPLSSCFLT